MGPSMKQETQYRAALRGLMHADANYKDGPFEQFHYAKGSQLTQHSDSKNFSEHGKFPDCIRKHDRCARRFNLGQ